MKQIYFGFIAFIVLTCFAFTLPRLVAVVNGNDGLAGAATAAIIFLTCLTAALVLGIVLLVQTLRNRAQLPLIAKVVGLLPLPLFAAVLTIFLYLLDQRQQQPSEPRPTTLTPTSP